jgi:hypothetical protein
MQKQPIDPHSQWLEGYRKAQLDFEAATRKPGGENFNTPEAIEAFDRLHEIECKLVDTNANTIHGL